MEIRYLGHSSFYIKSKNASVVTDPFSARSTGLKFPKHIESTVLTISHDHEDHNQEMLVEGSPFIVKAPGEYEIQGVHITGISSFHDQSNGQERGKNVMFRITLENLNILHLGDIGHVLSSDTIDELDGVDILMIPVGGMYTIGIPEALHIIKDIEPSIVIPMHFRTNELDQKAFGGLSTVEDFIKSIGKDAGEPVAKLVMTKDKLPTDTHVVVFHV